MPTFGLTNPQHAPATPPLLSTQLKGIVASAACQPCPLHAAGAPGRVWRHASLCNPWVDVNIQQCVSLYIFLGDLVAEAGQTSPHLGIKQWWRYHVAACRNWILQCGWLSRLYRTWMLN